MAAATGGVVFGDEADMFKLEDIQMHDFGGIGEVTVTKDDTLMIRVNKWIQFSSFLKAFSEKSCQSPSISYNLLIASLCLVYIHYQIPFSSDIWSLHPNNLDLILLAFKTR